MTTATSLRLVSWNVDGLDTERLECLSKFVGEEKQHVVCLNETKASESELARRLVDLTRSSYTLVVNAHAPSNQHGVAVLIRRDVAYQSVPVELKCHSRHDTKAGSPPTSGRVIVLEIEKRFYLVASYCPNAGSDAKKPLKNLGYRVEQWDPAMFALLEQLRAVKPVLWMGDLNVAPFELDVTHPVEMAQAAGYSEAERKSFGAFLGGGGGDGGHHIWVDVWRKQHPTQASFSWRSREDPSQAMRLDHCVASFDMLKSVRDSFIREEFATSSDHVPVGVVVQL